MGVDASTEFAAVSFDFSVAITTCYVFMKFYLLLIYIIIFEIGNFLKILILIDCFFSFFLFFSEFFADGKLTPFESVSFHRSGMCKENIFCLFFKRIPKNSKKNKK